MEKIELFRRFKEDQQYFTKVDDEDYEFLNQWRWLVRKNQNTCYAYRNERGNGKSKMIHMHRVIMKTPSELQVDHIFGDGLNNQKKDMRNCTFTQNIRNKKHHGNSKYKGVCYNGKHIRSVIFVNGKQLHLGYYRCEEDAAIAYNCAALLYFGEFAKLNTINL